MTVNPEFVNHLRLESLIDLATETLRDVFQQRWKEFIGGDWDNDIPLNVQTLKKRYVNYEKLVSSPQKKRVESGDITSWDLTLLTGILSNVSFGGPGEWREERHITSLRTARNVDGHNPTVFLCTDEEIQQIWPDVKSALNYFGADELRLARIENANFKELVQMVGINKQKVDAENTIQARELMSKAETLMSNEDFESAIARYSDALDLTGLPNADVANLYVGRSDTYLKWVHKVTPVNATVHNSGFLKKNVKLALDDARTAVQYQPQSYTGYYAAGKALMRLNKVEKALLHLELALSLAPARTEIEHDRDEARWKRGLESRGGEQKAPVDDLEEGKAKIMDWIRETYGPQVNLEHLARRFEDAENSIPGQADTNMGHDLRDGLNGVAQDVVEAVKFYETAYAKGNAEGTYSLALMYQKGHGVKQDFKQCIALLEEAANMPSTRPRSGQFDICIDSDSMSEPRVRGVATAAHALGILHLDGVGVPKNAKQAAEWFFKGSLGGCHGASIGLGKLYHDGEGVSRDWRKAVGFMRLAALQGGAGAMRWLAEFYVDTHDPALARTWFEHALDNKYKMDDLDKKAFEMRLVRLEMNLRAAMDQLEDWELGAGFQVDGLSIPERVQRMWNNESPGVMLKFKTLVDGLVDKQKRIKSDPRPAPKFDHRRMEDAAAKHSVTAQRVLSAMKHFERAEILASRQEGCTWVAIIPAWAEGCRHEPLAWGFKSIDERAQLHDRMMDFLRTLDTDAESQTDLDTRVCLASIANNDSESNLRFVEACRAKYPEELVFHRLAIKFYRSRQEFEKAVETGEEALRKFPGDVELLYNLAAVTDGHSRNHERPAKSIKAYKEFLAAAPADHPKVPRAFFMLAALTWQEEALQFKEKSKSEKPPAGRRLGFTRPQIKYSKVGLQYYQDAINAEKNQLPAFLAFHQNTVLKAKLALSLQAPDICTGLRATGNRRLTPTNTAVACTSSRTESETWETEKQILTSPHRAFAINEWRKQLVKSVAHFPNNGQNGIMSYLAIDKKRLQYAPKGWENGSGDPRRLPRITLVDMNPFDSRLHPNKSLLVTLIENSCRFGSKLVLLVEDSNRDVAPLTIDVDEAEGIEPSLKIGTKIWIANPYFQVMGEGDGTFRILVEDIFSLVLEYIPPKGERVCRFCGKAGGRTMIKCTKCHQAWYCNPKCRETDKSILSHHLICKILNLRR